MRTDSRGRIRFTHNGTRFEINKDGDLRSYNRDYLFNGSERSIVVNVNRLDPVGMSRLYRAVGQNRINQSKKVW